MRSVAFLCQVKDKSCSVFVRRYVAGPSIEMTEAAVALLLDFLTPGRDNPKTFYPPVTWTESINKGTKISRVNQQRYKDVQNQSTKVQRCPESINKGTKMSRVNQQRYTMSRVNQQRYKDVENQSTKIHHQNCGGRIRCWYSNF